MSKWFFFLLAEKKQEILTRIIIDDFLMIYTNSMETNWMPTETMGCCSDFNWKNPIFYDYFERCFKIKLGKFTFSVASVDG